ncbi:MAG TPA: DUF3102 domain-containing protein [Gammaproteobacteria bacterium]|nr:DUF3102 domain-containing protein [Gammaproteobacteria bacterium]
MSQILRLENTRALRRLAADISAEHDAARAAAEKAAGHAIRCGELLLQAKEKVPHGQWLKWVDENCGLGTRMIQAYMRLAKYAHRRRLELYDLSVREALEVVAETERLAKIEQAISRIKFEPEEAPQTPSRPRLIPVTSEGSNAQRASHLPVRKPPSAGLSVPSRYERAQEAFRALLSEEKVKFVAWAIKEAGLKP